MKNSIIIIGAGPAGIGMAIFLKKAGFEDVLILEKNDIGASFLSWPKETKFISPSFTSNFFGLPDLNAISPDTSPAHTIQKEHLNGKEYAEYLKKTANFFSLNIEKNMNVLEISRSEKENLWNIKIENTKDKKNIQKQTKYLIWAAGEFFYPDKSSFEGIENGIHYSKIKSYKDLKGDEFIVVGGYESGIDITQYLLNSSKKVTLIDIENPLEKITSDSSTSLSPYTRNKFFETFDNLKNKKDFVYYKNTFVEKIIKEKEFYKIILKNKKELYSKSVPIICTGFEGSTHFLIKNFFDWNGNRPKLSKNDESTLYKNLFLSGSHIVHENAVFCFIYKFRQRFAIIGETIAKREKISIKKVIKDYKKSQFYLKDISSCGDDCSC
jgi:putative flavoprotein involved in K+ transport